MIWWDASIRWLDRITRLDDCTVFHRNRFLLISGPLRVLFRRPREVVFPIFVAVETGLKLIEFLGGIWIENSWGGSGKSPWILGLWTTWQKMAEQLKTGPMTVEKQTVLSIRRRGALTRGPADSGKLFEYLVWLNDAVRSFGWMICLEYTVSNDLVRWFA